MQLALDYKTETNTCFYACKEERFLKGRGVWRMEKECHFRELSPEQLTSQHKYLLTSINHILRQENQKISTSTKPRSCKKGLLPTEQKEMLIKLFREVRRLKDLCGDFIFPTTLPYREKQISLKRQHCVTPESVHKTMIWENVKPVIWTFVGKKRISLLYLLGSQSNLACPVFMFYKPISKVSINIQN